MRHLINLVSILNEGLPRRAEDSAVMDWINAALARPDADGLYLHGSEAVFDRFRQPNTDYGHLIFASKLTNETGADRPFQAEYYGHNLYLLRIHAKKIFNPLNDPKARAIMAEALDGEYRWQWSDDGESRIYRGVWDFDQKMLQGRLDYENCDVVVPPAVAAGYDFFRVYEVSMRACSYGSADATAIEIVDRCLA